MSNPLEGITIDYHITSLPSVLYVGIHEASNIPEFNSFEIPSEVRTSPIECRFVIYDKDGDCLEFCSQMAPPHPISLTRIVNIVPLKMIEKLLKSKKI